MAIFGQMKDPRRRTKGNFKHELVEVVFLVISAVVSGCNDWETISVFGESQLEWLRKYYPYKNGLPSHDTINRLFSAMDSKVFGRYFIKWTQEICTLSDGDIVAIDGKSVRRSYDKNSGRSAIHIVSAYAQKNRICLGQVETGDKSNEITAIPELLDLLYLEKATVTIDAIGCQKEIVKKIVKEKKAHYVIAVKNNQKSLYEQIDKLFLLTKPASEHIDHHNDHGRVEKRKCSVIDDFTFMDDCECWEGLNSIIKVESERYTKTNKQAESETRYYISSHKADAQQLNVVVRNHWSVENNLHWMLDVVFAEDMSRRRAGNSPANFNMISKIALGLIERTPLKSKSKRQRRFKAGFDPGFREKVLNL
jgi:predicted transposase YbfD/YdcC